VFLAGPPQVAAGAFDPDTKPIHWSLAPELSTRNGTQKTTRTSRVAAKRLGTWARLEAALRTGPWTLTLVMVVGSGLVGASVAKLVVPRPNPPTIPAGDGTGAIFIDGARRCAHSPCVVDLPAGTHTVTISVGADKAALSSLAPPAPGEEARAPVEPRPPVAPSPASPFQTQSTARAQQSPLSPPTPTPAGMRIDRGTTASSSAAPKPAAADPGASARPCRLKLNSFPVASVALDGKVIGDTPRMDVLTPAGDHRAVFSVGPQQKAVSFHCTDDEDKALAVRLP
jgi:hypothetical protein